MVGEHFFEDEASPGETEIVIKFGFGVPDVVEGDFGELGHLHHGGEGMQAPKREHVVAMTRHGIEVVDPEIPLPYLRDVRLRGIGAVGVARSAQIERNIELDASLLDVRFVFGAFEAVECSKTDGLSDVEATIHRAAGISSEHRDAAFFTLVLNADAVALCGCFGVLLDGDGNAGRIRIITQSYALGRGLAANLLGGEHTGFACGGIVREMEARGECGGCECKEQEGEAGNHGSFWRW